MPSRARPKHDAAVAQDIPGEYHEPCTCYQFDGVMWCWKCGGVTPEPTPAWERDLHANAHRRGGAGRYGG